MYWKNTFLETLYPETPYPETPYLETFLPETPQLFYVRALRGLGVGSGSFGDVDIELNGRVARRITGVVTAGLISQGAMNREVAWTGNMRCGQLRLYGEVSGIDVQLLARVKRKSEILAGRVHDSSGCQIGRQVELESRGDQEFRFGLVGVYVKAFFHAEMQINR